MAKNDLKELLSYKSDMTAVEKLRDQLVTKCDYDYVQNLLQKIRTELDQQIELGINSSDFAKRNHESERHLQASLTKHELDLSKLKDDMAMFKDSLSR